MKEENEDGDEVSLKICTQINTIIIILNTIIKIFSEDSIVVKCMQFTLWCIHGDNGKAWFH